MGQGTYNNYQLTGERIITPCIASGTGMLNTHTGCFDRELLEELGVKEDQIARLVKHEETFPLTAQAAELLGLPSGIPVLATNSDGGLNQIGAGAVETGVMTLSVGTSGAMRLTTNKPVLPEQPSTWCYMSPKNWLSGAATNGCTNCLDWFKDQFLLGNFTYEELEQGLTDSETNPIYLPFHFGERCPGWNDEKKGSFHNVLPEHKIHELYLAVQEGILFNLYHCYTILSELNGEPTNIRLSGGILNSPRWTQMCADIFQKKLELNQNEHDSLLGGAVLAMEVLGVLQDAADYKPLVSRTVHPNPKMAKHYKNKFNRYLECYNQGK